MFLLCFNILLMKGSQLEPILPPIPLILTSSTHNKVVWSTFIALSCLNIKYESCSPLELIPTKFLLKVMKSVRPCLLHDFNTFLVEGLCPWLFLNCLCEPTAEKILAGFLYTNFRVTFLYKNVRENSVQAISLCTGMCWVLLRLETSVQLLMRSIAASY